ncbi:GGDEF domain-containing protein [Ottowia sp.]|uniref:GGDEF domain-containing protein n=1 Tax=Ottowia sp. TaxID=1898956 RepID=UPI0026095CD7|nr:GGDEF domain-containing protein [Ottowia sp.]
MLSALFRRRRRAKLVSRIVALQLALAQAERALHQDDLTALLNRRGFRRACDAHPGHVPEVLSCVMIDLDNFKGINDTHGHPAGDAALVQFAAALRRCLRSDDAVARLGGDEFALLLAGVPAKDVERILLRLQIDLQQAHDSCKMPTATLGFSAGIAERVPWESLAQTLSRADTALLDAKRQGKSCFVWAAQPTQ